MILIKNFPSGRALTMIALNNRTHRKLKSLHKTFTAGKHFIIFFLFLLAYFSTKSWKNFREKLLDGGDKST